MSYVCPFCGGVDRHWETCEGFALNDPAREVSDRSVLDVAAKCHVIGMAGDSGQMRIRRELDELAWPEPCDTCRDRGRVTVYSGEIHHPLGVTRVDHEYDTELDIPPGGRFYGGSWTVTCPDCHGESGRIKVRLVS